MTHQNRFDTHLYKYLSVKGPFTTKEILMKNLFILIALLIPSSLICQHDAEMHGSNEGMPVFPDCDKAGDSRKSKQDCTRQKLVEYIYGNLIYPAEAKAKKVEGMAVVQFYINEDGSMSDIKLVRDIEAGCGQAALDVVNSLSNLETQDTTITFDDQSYEETFTVVSRKLKWRPGYQNGKAVKVLYTLPVRFKLDNNRVEQTLEKASETKATKWRNYPPEYSSYQDYKEKVLVPKLVKKVYTIEPIAKHKIVGDIIPYGNAMHPILKKLGSHNGIDFRAVPGVPVMATADGIIESISTDHERYGQVVKIKHSPQNQNSSQIQSLYAHMSSINVKEGQSVKAGEQIGAVGMTGKASYPHLHYEVHINGQTENPILYNQNKNENVNQNQAQNQTKNLIIAIEENQKLETTTDIQFDLQQNFPNPVLDYTTIKFNLPSDRPASLLFYNLSGEYVHGIKDSFRKGLNEIRISTTDLNANGIIYYFLIQDQMTAVKKLVISK